MTEKKRYSFLNMKNAVGKNGKPYVAVTLQGMVCNPRPINYVDDKMVLNFSVPIYSRAKYIESLFGAKPSEDKNGVVWAQVSCWQSGEKGLASRLNNLLQANAGKTLILTMTGAIKVVDGEDKQGRTYKNVRITCDDFNLERVMQPRNDGEASTNDGQPKADGEKSVNQTVPTSTGGSQGVFYDIDQNDELPF